VDARDKRGHDGERVQLIALAGLLELPFQLDMDALAQRGMMPLPRSQQRLRFLGGFGLHPPLLEARDEEAGMEGFQPLLRPLFLRDGGHQEFPELRIGWRNYFTLKPARGTKRKRRGRSASPPMPERAIIQTIVNALLVRS